MYNNDYIVMIDENGQPYIAHAYATDGKGSNTRQGIRSGFKAGIGSGLRAAWGSLSGRKPKYDRKEFKNGRWNYIYDEAKKAAKKAWASKAGRFIDEHDAGISERLMANYYRRKGKKADKSGRHQDAENYRSRAMSLYRESKDEGERAKRTLAAAPKRAWGSKAGRWIDEHDAGISERLMANYYRRKGKKADKSGRHQEAENYRTRAMSLYREGKDESAATRERLRSLTTRKKKVDNSSSSANSSSSTSASSASSNSQSSSKPKIPSYANVSDEYLLAMGSNSGIDVRSFMSAQSKLQTAQRAMTKAKSGQERSSAQRQLKEAQAEYDRLRKELIDDINKL